MSAATEATIRAEEVRRADRAMARVFNRIAKCQDSRPDAGCCGECLLHAILVWRRYMRRRR